jgi:hypothetical protein
MPIEIRPVKILENYDLLIYLLRDYLDREIRELRSVTRRIPASLARHGAYGMIGSSC